MSYQDFEKQYNQSKAMQDYAKKYVVSRLTDLKTRIDEQSDSRDVSFKLLLIKQMIDGEDPDEIRKYSIPNFLEKWKKGRFFRQLAVKTQKYLFDQLMPKAVEQGQICKVYYILHAYDEALLVDAKSQMKEYRKSTDLMSNSSPNSNVNDYWNDTEEYSENDAPNLAEKYIFSVKETPFHTNRLSNKNILGTRNNKIPTRPAISENKNKIHYQELDKVGGNRNALLQTSRILEKDQGITTIEKSSIDSGCYCF